MATIVDSKQSKAKLKKLAESLTDRYEQQTVRQSEAKGGREALENRQRLSRDWEIGHFFFFYHSSQIYGRIINI